jgi:hypothetical protein
VVVTAVQDERVTVPGASFVDSGDRIVDCHIPRQAGVLCDRRHWDREAVRH